MSQNPLLSSTAQSKLRIFDEQNYTANYKVEDMGYQ
jgi:hypothetical protein